ncbi:hypothetical protein [Commensalibacter oyaizuii]|uniref:Membrane protein YfhO n=1 Tax=Commensalibacter oyaizuii TaxID=3043873 RepID=A0ABT6Q261_9PROT|nr:hypothetical protein [Commensalibacter sp. TBRC 16381]MDI2091105.1 hypothetical protein [Commensalibacter sp. TBRC 16381]
MSFTKNMKLFFGFMLFSLLIIVICTLRNHYFFTLDDAENEYLGFMHQYGQSWKNGEIPFITKDLLVGGNAMVELQRAIFAPHNIIGSILNASNHILISTGLFFAFVNMMTLCFSGYIIGRTLNIKRNLCVTLGLFLAINPMFLFQYSGPWWNAANGHAISILSIASIFYLIKNQTRLAYTFNFLTVFWLLVSGWPHGFIGYLVISICLIISFSEADIKSAFYLFFPTLCAGISAIPIYSEFIYLKAFIERPSGWDNVNNFLVPSLSQMLLSFSPSYYEHMNYWGGYRTVFFPIGFSTIFFVFSCFFLKIDLKSKTTQTLIIIAALLLLLCQMPSQAGMLRYPYRFLPLFSSIITIFTFYVINRYEITVSRQRQQLFYFFISIFIIVSISTCFFELKNKVLIANLITFCLLTYVYLAFFKNKNLKEASTIHLSLIPFCCFLIMIFVLPGVGKGKYMYESHLPNQLRNLNKLNLSGYTLSFSGGTGSWQKAPKELADLNSSQFGYYDIKSTTGYSPNGHKFLDQIIVHHSPHTTLNQEDALLPLLRKIPELNNVCMINLLNVTNVVLHNNVNFEQIKQCGFTNSFTGARDYTYANYKRNLSTTLSYSLIPNTTVKNETNNTIKLYIPDSAQKNTLIFSRAFWPGYTASGLACNVQISGFENALLSAQIPAHCSGNLTISYFPKTWKYTLFFAVIGIIAFLVFLIYNYKRKPTVKTCSF